MEEKAVALGTDAIVGVDIDCETINQSMIMATSSGTAVVIDQKVLTSNPHLACSKQLSLEFAEPLCSYIN